jgi:predicted N-acetyltransferase YhbS
MMEIRAMDMGDIPELAALYKEFWNEDSDVDRMRSQYRWLSGNGSYVLLSAVEDGRLVGSVMGIVCEELYGECRPFLVAENLIVKSGYRRRGIGAALMAALEERAAAKGCGQIILVTDTPREDARGFYAALGFDPDSHKGFKKKVKR